MMMIKISQSAPGTLHAPSAILPHVGVQFSLGVCPIGCWRRQEPVLSVTPYREFMSYIQRYRTFFATLPEMLCETEMVDEFWTCWNGEEVVER